MMKDQNPYVADDVTAKEADDIDTDKYAPARMHLQAQLHFFSMTLHTRVLGYNVFVIFPWG